MGWLIALFVLVLLLLLPLVVSMRYDTAGTCVSLRIGFIPVNVFPVKKREKKRKTNAKKNKKAEASQQKRETSKAGGSITDFLPLLQICLNFLNAFGRKLRVSRLEIKIILGGSDPCDLAINYGRAWAAVGNLIPSLERIFVIKKRDVEVACDFTSEKTLVFTRLDLSISIIGLLMLVVYHGIHVLREYMKIMNQRKGGAQI